MDTVTIEKAKYIIGYYSNLLTPTERKALRHLRSTIKLEGETDERRSKMYYKTGWLSTDPDILQLVADGPDQFMLNCAKRILKDNPDKVFLNLCPVCKKLARTPDAKQCRFCHHDWH